MKGIRYIVCMFVCLMIVCISSAFAQQRLSVMEAKELLTTSTQPVALLDVRTAGEYAGGHISGALLYDYNEDDFERKLMLLPRNYHYVIYSNNGNRSLRAMRMMQQMGFSSSHVEGGLERWKSAGLPVVK